MSDAARFFLDPDTFTKLGLVKRDRLPMKRAWLAVKPKLVGSVELADYLKAIEVLPPEATTAWLAEYSVEYHGSDAKTCMAENLKIYYTVAEEEGK